MAGDASSCRCPTARRRLLLALVGFAVALVLAEGLLQLAPGLLPAGFRERFPLHGVEFFHRGLLDRTPLRAGSASQMQMLEVPSDAIVLSATLLENRAVLEQAMLAFCTEQHITMWSATPGLEAAIAAGDDACYATDSHWTAIGQRAVAEGLIAESRRTGLFTE